MLNSQDRGGSHEKAKTPRSTSPGAQASRLQCASSCSDRGSHRSDELDCSASSVYNYDSVGKAFDFWLDLVCTRSRKSNDLEQMEQQWARRRAGTLISH